MNGAQLAAGTLAAAGVRRVFSVSGNQILPLYDALFGQRIEIVHARHEGAAVHMADAYARLSGTTGVCLVTAGPGHANALGALSMAEAAESPVLLLSGHAPLGRPGAFQEMDQVALARPLTRFAAVAERAAAIPDLLARAFRAAQEGQPGPVHLSLPVDVLGATANEPVPVPEPAAFQVPQTALDRATLERALDALRRAERPLILAGPAAARPGVYQALAALSARSGLPFLLLDHPRGLGDPSLGRAAAAVPRADALLLLAKRQDFRLSFGGPPTIPTGATLIQIDPSPEELERHRPPDLSLVAGAAAAAGALLEASSGMTWPRNAWTDEVEALRAAPPRGMPAPGDVPASLTLDGGETVLHPVRVFDALAALVERLGPARVSLSIDGGEFGQWARARLRARPPYNLVAEPLGSIGFSLPFAIAARLAQPERVALAIAGDGAFGFHGMELETAARLGVPLLAVVGTDAAWGTERHLQVSRYGAGRTPATDLLPARYDQLATALGGHGVYVSHPDHLESAFDEALAAVERGLPTVLNARIASLPSPAEPPP